MSFNLDATEFVPGGQSFAIDSTQPHAASSIDFQFLPDVPFPSDFVDPQHLDSPAPFQSRIDDGEEQEQEHETALEDNEDEDLSELILDGLPVDTFSFLDLDGEDSFSNDPPTIEKELLSIFPLIPPATIVAALKKNDGDWGVTMDELLDRAVLKEGPGWEKTDDQRQRARRKGPCRFHMQGWCARKDCEFSHDLGSMMCKHGSTVSVESLRPSDFPSLATPKHSPVPSEPRILAVQVQPRDPPSAVKREDFPSLAAVKSSKQGVKPTSSKRATTVSSSNATSPPSFASALRKTPPKPPSSRATPTPPLGGAGRSRVKSDLPSRVSLPWVETGVAASNEFLKERREAEEHAVARNRYFQLAAEMVRRGDGGGAKEMARLGHNHQDLSRRAHARAADVIFTARNAKLTSLNTPGSSMRVIDLHGLLTHEATDKTSSMIESLRMGGFTGHLAVVTGTGHHSLRYDGAKGPSVPGSSERNKMFVAVAGMLDERGLQWREAKGTDGRGGVIMIGIY
ncbi:hypothetical protein M427DRAFT_68778 [Gonapodya prolifera JEL478]|uniref:C3H1-type domain-containing protein n=1 Tax=Gonapodya prolifera (strain JEL478) TaxID=1344416 RepID=A0A139AKW4_GONPJ|nr:hypothetical protein M427DRAFT_68778 [Gonapodya prolifera JEL478]|eukprot:KXS17065.1 hypothetical protein M427DRAFT_68778 [Gonapodya prolifera JEL478]